MLFRSVCGCVYLSCECVCTCLVSVCGVGKQKDGETRRQAKNRTGERKRRVLLVGTGKRTMHPFCTGSKDSSSWGSGSNPFPGLILFQFVLGPAILPLGMCCFITRQLFCKLHRPAWGCFSAPCLELPIRRHLLFL